MQTQKYHSLLGLFNVRLMFSVIHTKTTYVLCYFMLVIGINGMKLYNIPNYYYNKDRE